MDFYISRCDLAHYNRHRVELFWMINLILQFFEIDFLPTLKKNPNLAQLSRRNHER